MTRHDYELLSRALALARPRRGPERDVAAMAQWRADCQAIADALAAQSSGFDARRFILDCNTL